MEYKEVKGVCLTPRPLFAQKLAIKTRILVANSMHA